MRDAALEYAQLHARARRSTCPTPSRGSAASGCRSPEGVSPSKMAKADEACRKYLEAVKPPEMSRGAAEGVPARRRSRTPRCMREHGIDIPDPTFGENGGAQIRIRRGSGIEPGPDDPKFQKAAERRAAKSARRRRARRHEDVAVRRAVSRGACGVAAVVAAVVLAAGGDEPPPVRAPPPRHRHGDRRAPRPRRPRERRRARSATPTPRALLAGATGTITAPAASRARVRPPRRRRSTTSTTRRRRGCCTARCPRGATSRPA